MSEIGERTKLKMWKIIDGCAGNPAVDVVGILLSIPELAIVDRVARLPTMWWFHTIDEVEYENLLKAGWAKEVK